MWKLVKSYDCKSSVEQFLNSIFIWINKPQVVDRNLCGSTNTYWYPSLDNIFIENLNDLHTNIFLILKDASNWDLIVNITNLLIKNLQLRKVIQMDNFKNMIILRCIIPKNIKKYKYFEIVIYDVLNGMITFFPFARFLINEIEKIEDLNFSYSFQLTNTKLELFIYEKNNIAIGSNSCSTKWLENVLFEKIVNWSKEDLLNTDCTTLQLVNFEDYNKKYYLLKNKYGPFFVKNWSEQTDPKKFVYEDIGIATYLILIWEKEDWNILEKKYKFIDLGCGNGLLVYILSAEGYIGYGVDIRKRKIWNSLKEYADLREQVFTPKELYSCKDVEWIIGNHSDELTPWIPVLASKSNCQYFVIPCCFWDFFERYSSKGPSSKYLTNYEKYLNFVHKIGEICNFNIYKDILRIPSTKKVCFVGIKRHDALEVKIDETIENFISSRSGLNWKTYNWANHFVPRPYEQKITNAITLATEVKERVWLKTYQYLLTIENFIDLPNGISWNCGGAIELSEISNLNKNDMNALKSESGGLQTLLRNCPDIFMIKGGKVSIRNWFSKDFLDYKNSRKKTSSSKSDRDSIRTKICFHNLYHPQGCPIIDENTCRFLHKI